MTGFDDTEDQMTEEEVAAHFGVKPLKKKKSKEKSIEYMTRDELLEWERKQDNSNDIYKVAARVNNLARSNGGNLTPAGIAMCNSFTHVFKDLYDFAEKIRNKKIKNALIELIRSKEKIPGDLIAALSSGVKQGDSKK